MTSKNIAIIMDPLESINTKKDTTYALMVEAQKAGHNLFYVADDGISINNSAIIISANALTINDGQERWFACAASENYPVDQFDLFFMRKDPPFDQHYLYATYLLDLIEKAGVKVVNNPGSMRDYNEKLFALQFPQCCPDYLVTSKKQEIIGFIDQYHDIILKPLHGMGGEGVFRIQHGDANTNVIIEMLTEHENTLVIAQQFITDVFKSGDKRILMIAGEPYPYALARMPAKGETRANLAAGGQGHAVLLSKQDKWICEQVGAVLKEKGLFFVGLDVIGDYLTEVNVTSPTGLRELSDQTQTNIAEQVWQAIFK